jgi:flagellar assembly protein FliH
MNQYPRSQSGYRPTPYARSHFEQVGKKLENDEFEPMRIEVVHTEDSGVVDRMFSNYGGGIGYAEEVRHARNPKEIEKQKEVDAVHHITLEADQFEAMMHEQFASGLSQGRNEVESDLRPKLDQALARVEVLCADLTEQIHQEFDQVEHRAVDLAIAIAKRIINEAVEINPEYLLPVLRQALEYSSGGEVKRVRVSPADMEFIQVEKIRKRFPGSWDFVADESITAGCVVETTTGDIDYRLDESWNRVKDQIVRSVSR